MKAEISPKTEIAPRVLLGISVAAAVVIVGLLVYFIRANDPATRPPIPYKPFDYSKHMQDTNQYGRAPSPGSGLSQPSEPAAP